MDLQDFEVVQKAPPHDISTWIKIVALIRNNKSQEIVEFPCDGIWDEKNFQPSLFIWQDGNFSCDCNRAIFWNEVSEKKKSENCGHKRFSVNLKNPKTGEIFYKEY
jgi:hypothetical protein